MRPVPIPDEWVWEDSERKVVMPPNDDLDSHMPPVDVVTDETPDGNRFNVLIAVEETDFESLRECPFFWVSIFADELPPFAITSPADQAPEEEHAS